MTTEDKVLKLLARKLSGTASEKDMRELVLLMEQDPELAARVDSLSSLWINMPVEKASGKEDSLSILRSRIAADSEGSIRTSDIQITQYQSKTKESPLIPLKKLMRVAAIFLIFTLLTALSSYFFQSATFNFNVSFIESANAVGVRSKIELPDSTIVWLNGASMIRYPSSFSCTNRVIYLEGEASFEISEHCDYPFIINTGNLVTIANTPLLNINAFPEEKDVIVTVDGGNATVIGTPDMPETMPLIELRKYPGREAESVNMPMMKLTKAKKIVNEDGHTEMLDLYFPKTVVGNHEAVTYNSNNNTMIKYKPVNLFQTFAWKTGELIFNNDPLPVFVKKIERWYGGNISLDISSKDTIRFTGRFQDAGLNDVLSAFKEETGLMVKKNGDEIIIYN